MLCCLKPPAHLRIKPEEKYRFDFTEYTKMSGTNAQDDEYINTHVHPILERVGESLASCMPENPEEVIIFIVMLLFLQFDFLQRRPQQQLKEYTTLPQAASPIFIHQQQVEHHRHISHTQHHLTNIAALRLNHSRVVSSQILAAAI
jgi:hypothetical protein